MSAVATEILSKSVHELSAARSNKHLQQPNSSLLITFTLPKMLSATKSTIARPQVASRQRTVSVRAQAPQVRSITSCHET